MKKLLYRCMAFCAPALLTTTLSHAQATFTADLEFLPEGETTEYTIEVGDSLDIGLRVVNHGPDAIDTSNFVLFSTEAMPAGWGLIIQSYDDGLVPLPVGDTVVSRGIRFLYTAEFAYERDTTFQTCYYSIVNEDMDEFVFDPNQANDTTCFTITYKGTGPSSLKNRSIQQALKIWPNPATDIVHVPFDANKTTGNASIRISSVDGRTVYNADITGSRNSSVDVDTKGWVKGLYFVSLQTANGTQTGRFTVQ